MESAAAIVIAALVLVFGFEALEGDQSPSRTVSPAPSSSVTPGSPVVSVPPNTGSVFGFLGEDMDVFGNRSVEGDAFVISTKAGTSFLLTDYHLLFSTVMQGKDTVDLQRGDQTFTAKVVAVSPDPDVALLRIGGTFDPLPVSLVAPKPGDSVTLSPYSPASAHPAAVIAYDGPSLRVHLSFSAAVPNGDAGAPVLNSAGQVVGVAEPSSEFQTQGVGFALRIAAACAAVAGC